VDGRRAAKGARLMAGQIVETTEPVMADVEEPPLTVLYEDSELVAVAKPAGVPSQPLRAGERGTVATALALRYPECAQASPDPREGGLAHRLDTGTSGVLVAARHRAAWERLRLSLSGPDCEKVYLAEVVGTPSYESLPFVEATDGKLVVSAPIGRTGRRGGRVKLAGGRQPLGARTEVEVVERRQDTTLVRARLGKGRAHQVRVHLAHLGSPVVGDDVYGRGGSGLHLHALSVSFRHPSTGEIIRIEAAPPDWAVQQLRS
jgi:23S rRNA pseudouridine1911/1915/1917 synthase